MEDTECIVAKAIRDGGIDATLDHAARTMSSRETADVYATPEPAAAFHARVAFCLDIHNEVCALLTVMSSKQARPARALTQLTDAVTRRTHELSDSSCVCSA